LVGTAAPLHPLLLGQARLSVAEVFHLFALLPSTVFLPGYVKFPFLSFFFESFTHILNPFPGHFFGSFLSFHCSFGCRWAQGSCTSVLHRPKAPRDTPPVALHGVLPPHAAFLQVNQGSHIWCSAGFSCHSQLQCGSQ
jgi:hypothetical protein